MDAGDSLGAQSRVERAIGNGAGAGKEIGIGETGFGGGFANLQLVEASLTQACITKATGSGDANWRGASLLTS